MPRVTDPGVLAALNGGSATPAPQPNRGAYEQAIGSPNFSKEVSKTAAKAETDIQKSARKDVLSVPSLRNDAYALKQILRETPTGPLAIFGNPIHPIRQLNNLNTIDKIGSEQLFSSGKLEQMKGALSDSDRNWLRSLNPSSKKFGDFNMQAANAMEWLANRREAYDNERIKWERKYGSIQKPNEQGKSFDELFLRWADQKYPRPDIVEYRQRAAQAMQSNDLGRVISVRPVAK